LGIREQVLRQKRRSIPMETDVVRRKFCLKLKAVIYLKVDC